MLIAMSRHAAPGPVRPPRRAGLAMLALMWLLIALLPLRALSQELMGAAQRAAQPAGVQRAAMPCHAGAGPAEAALPSSHHAAADGGAVITDVADGPVEASGADGATSDEPAANCSACDLCHAALAGPVASAPGLCLPPARDLPATPAGPSVAVAADGIFKPPRG